MDRVEFKPSPYGMYRTNTNWGSNGKWEHFEKNSNGSYRKDGNGDYIYNPKWVENKNTNNNNSNKKRNGNKN
jgi:hypothetical protein